jgi:predicted amidohydrolase
VKVAAVQHDIVWEDPEANFARLEPLVAAAAGQGARLVVLTEMFATGFSMAADRIAEPAVGGRSAEFLTAAASEHGVWMCGSIPERRAGGGRPCNQLLLVGPDGETHRYAKIHPFSYAGEHEHYEAGTETLTVDVGGVRVSPFVCYDLRFPEEMRSVAEETDLYVVVANWPAPRRRHWQVLLQARAIEDQAYVVGVNRVGHGDGLDYAGDSMVIDPMGEVLASAAGGEAILVTEVDPAVVRDVRTSLPFLQDRRR